MLSRPGVLAAAAAADSGTSFLALSRWSPSSSSEESVSDAVSEASLEDSRIFLRLLVLR